MFTFRVRWRAAGGHVHTRLFAAPSPHHTFTLLGELVFNVQEWNLFRGLTAAQVVSHDGRDTARWEFREEGAGEHDF